MFGDVIVTLVHSNPAPVLRDREKVKEMATAASRGIRGGPPPAASRVAPEESVASTKPRARRVVHELGELDE